MSDSRLIVERALELGFDRVGIVPVETPSRYDAFERWLAADMHGEMGYMARNTALRRQPALLHEGALSVVAVAMSHNPDNDDGQSGGVARYARGRDYHKLMRRRLAQLGAFIDAELGPGACAPRPFVDSAPVLERDVAQAAGLGWYGKSTNIIDQSLGSYLFVGHGLEPITREAPDRCGTCTACIDLCPTGAIVAPYVVDGRRCISYLTIELRGPIPIDLRPLIGDHVFGCDICQIVCPWNNKAAPCSEAAFRARPELMGLSAADMLSLSDDAFDLLTRGSPLRRTGRTGLARNAAVVLGNSGDPQAIPSLIAALEGDPSPLVRGHAAWALSQFDAPKAGDALDRARARETDDYVLSELRR